MSAKKRSYWNQPRTKAPKLSDRERRHMGVGEDVPVDQVIDMGARRAGIDPRLFEELTVADLARLGVRVRQGPPPRGRGRPRKAAT